MNCGPIAAAITTLTLRANPLLPKLLEHLGMLLRALAVNGAHQLPLFLRAEAAVRRDVLARECCLFPPACILFEEFENGFS